MWETVYVMLLCGIIYLANNWELVLGLVVLCLTVLIVRSQIPKKRRLELSDSLGVERRWFRD